MSPLVGKRIHRKVPAWTPDSPISVNRAGSSHPFVPSELRLVAYYIVHRSQRPIRRTVQTCVSRDTFAGQQRPYSCAISSFSLGSLVGVFTLPTSQPLPTNLRQLAGHRHPRNFRARSLSHPRVKVFQRHVLADRLDGRLHENPSQPRRPLPGNRTSIAMPARLMYPAG